MAIVEAQAAGDVPGVADMMEEAQVYTHTHAYCCGLKFNQRILFWYSRRAPVTEQPTHLLPQIYLDVSIRADFYLSLYSLS